MEKLLADLASHSNAVAVATSLLGLCVGSFLNVVIHRIPIILEHQWQREAALIRNEEPPNHPRYSLASPRSSCPHCGHGISALENIPVVSFILLRGRCKQCKSRISVRYPLIELLTAVLTTAVVTVFGLSAYSIGALFFLWALIVLSFIDLDTHLLPDNITLPLVWFGILFNLITQSIPLEESVIGATAGYLSLWSIYWVFKLTTGKEGMGYGDFKLLAAIGSFLGWKALLIVIMFSSSLGALISLSLVLFGKSKRGEHIPFGPYLSVSGVIALAFEAYPSLSFF